MKKQSETQRNWEVVGLIPHERHFTVKTKVDGVERDSGWKPTELGEFALTRPEIAILKRGITASGKDRKPNAGTAV